MRKMKRMSLMMTAALAVSAVGTGVIPAMADTSSDPVEVTYWDQNASEVRTQIYTHLIEEFEKENPDIKINFVPIPASEAKAKYDVAIQSNTAPDCGGVSQYWMSDFIVQDALVPLDDYIEEWDDAEYMLDMYQ